ncbi:hypothetical protein SAMN05421747_11597 [Parapedobacter composti]|uniref:Uncharacterized protein n=1 Tax=Parapedobacter composti TaxID=623281 RepID=A0A1I1KDT3_9SPHI|nr:hypothetical protein [Parapedobacter composti]SFC58956.1 hypothetical protein SAMN05421747_11597 [Parapedobacter composti]
MDYTGPVYALAYPTLPGYFETVPEPSYNLVHRNVFINFRDPIYAKGKTMAWRIKALGVSRANIFRNQADILTEIRTSGLQRVLGKEKILDPIPVEEIGLTPSAYIATQPSAWGLSHVYICENKRS